MNFAQIGRRLTAQQLITADRALHLVLILEVALQNCPRTQLPVGRSRAHCTPAVSVVHIALDFFSSQIHAQAELLMPAEHRPKINRSERSPSMICGQIYCLNHGWALGNVVDKAAG